VLARLVGGLLLRWTLVVAVLISLGLLVGSVADRAWPLTAEDDLNSALEQGRTPAWNDVTYLMGWLGATAVVVGVCLLAAVLLRRTLGRWRESLLVMTVTLGQSVVFLLTTLAIDRERPDVEQLDNSPPTSSFPSGHTSAAIALYTSLALVAHRRVRRPWLRRLMIGLLLALPVLVAAARLYRGMHHPSDIVGSLVNAGLLLLLTDRLLRATPLPDDGDVPVSGGRVADGGRAPASQVRA
jgi:undecaprenyl-diphosphatase